MAVTGDGLRIGTPPYWPLTQQPVVHDGHFVRLEWVGGDLRRSAAPLDCEHRLFCPRPLKVEPGPPPFATTSIYQMFFSQELPMMMAPCATVQKVSSSGTAHKTTASRL